MKITPLAVTLLATLSSAQTTWYVDVHAAAPGLGTQVSPYASIQYAHNQSATHNSDTILVAPGVYDERLTITKRVTVRSSQGPLSTAIKPTVTGTVVSLDGTIDQFANTVLDGFTIHAFGTAGYAVTTAQSGTMRNCIVIGNGHGTGAMTNYDFAIEHCLITNNVIGMASAYINFIYPKHVIVVGNSNYDVDISNADFSKYCCYVTGYFNATVGLVTSDPMLYDRPGHDFHLLAGSPCIDAGDPSAPLDPDGSRTEIGPLTYDAGYVPFAAYCTAKVNSVGCVPAISAAGTPSFTASTPFTITCANELNNKLGLLFYGQTPLANQYQGGWLCVATPVKRTAVIDSAGNPGADDCSGAYAFEFNSLIQGGLDPALVPGAVVYAQFWSRDPSSSYTTNRSDALTFGIAP